MSDNVEKIKNALNIEEVVGSYVKLEGAGKNMKARCPFHNERTPSFYVTPDKGIFKCFGCGKGGDIFSFVQEIEGLDFYGALKLLAGKAGITLTREQSQGNSRSSLYDLMDLAKRWYEIQLRTTPEVVQYLLGRGLTKETLKRFHVGYAPAGWENIYKVLRGKRFSDQEMKDAGMTSDGKRGQIDRFRERIMFPINDTQGRTIAFSGRIFPLTDSQTDTSKVGKYVNSPEGVLYDKSRVLFGYDQAKRAMLTKDRCVIVEGQIDLLMAHQAGTTESVAISGTALTEHHCKLIRRFTEKIILALDGDEAGLKAAERSVAVAYGADMDVRVVLLPSGSDPADVIQNSVEQWETLLKEASGYLDARLTLMMRELGGSTVQDRLKAVRAHIFPTLRYVTNPIYRDTYVQSIAGLLGVGAPAVREEFARWESQHQLDTVKENLNATSNTAKVRGLSPVEVLIGVIEYLRGQGQDVTGYVQDFETLRGADSFQQEMARRGALVDELLTRVTIAYGEDIENYHRVIQGSLQILELETLKKRQHDLRVRMQTEHENLELLKELEEVNRQIDGFKGEMNER